MTDLHFYTDGPREVVRYTAEGEWIAIGDKPMTDLQTLTVIFARAGIGTTIEATRAVGNGSANGDELPRGMTLTAARVDETTRRSFGYFGFYAELYFDDEGALVGVGAWE